MHGDDRQTFENRHAAGHALAALLQQYTGRGDVVVLGLPRGGVPVAIAVAEAIAAPVDLFLVRKLGTPGHRELAMGAIASGGVRVLNTDVVYWYGVTPTVIEAVTQEEQYELERREAAYREGRAPTPLEGRIVILIDDGLATGSTMQAAVQAVKQQKPAKVVVAVPVGAREKCNELSAVADEVVCARMPESFFAVGQWYLDFGQTTDEEIRQLLRTHARGARSLATPT